jgi:hypothetical protein
MNVLRWLILCTAMFFSVVLFGQVPEKPSPEVAPPPNLQPPGFEQIPFPANSIVVITNDLKQALRSMDVGAVLLSAEQYRDLLAKAAKATPPAAKPRPEPLFTSCNYQGQIVQDKATGRETLVLDVRIGIKTTRADTVLPLGFKGARLAKAELAGSSPNWTNDADGYAVLIEKPGLYDEMDGDGKFRGLHLEMHLSVQSTGDADRRASISLEQVPRSAITRFSMTVPSVVRNATLKGVGALQIDARQSGQTRIYSDALGVIDSMDLTWQVVGDRPQQPTVSVQALLEVTVREKVVETEGRLTIETRQGVLGKLPFRGPLQVNVMTVFDDVRGTQEEVKAEKGVFTIGLRQPLASGQPPISLRVRFQQPSTGKPGTALSVGRFELADMPGSPQTGTIQVNLLGAAATLVPHGLTPIDSFRYRYDQQPVRLDLRFEQLLAIPGIVETKPTYTVRLTPSNVVVVCEWQVSRVVRMAVQELEIRCPKEFLLNRQGLPANVVLQDPIEGLLRVQFTNAPEGPFKLRVEGWLPTEERLSANFSLPFLSRAVSERQGKREVADVINHGGQLEIHPGILDVALTDGTVGLLTANQRVPDRNAPLVGTSSFTLESRTGPDPWHLSLLWSQRRHTVELRAELYLTGERYVLDQTAVVQLARPDRFFWVHLSRTLLNVNKVRLRYSNREGASLVREVEFEGMPQLTEEGVLRSLPLPLDVQGTFELSVSHYANADARSLGVPSEQGDRSELRLPLLSFHEISTQHIRTEVRAWSTADVAVELGKSNAWTAAPLPPLPSAEVLPSRAFVNMSNESMDPLTLVLRSQEPSNTDVIVDRSLIEVSGLPSDRLLFRATAWLPRLTSDSVTVDLPADATLLRSALNRVEVRENPVENVGGSQRHRFVLTDLRQLAQPAHLDLEYRATVSSWPMKVLPAPQFGERGQVGLARWRVEWPGYRLLLLRGTESLPEQTWRWTGWLGAPAPALNRPEMVYWLGGNSEPQTARPAYSFMQTGSISPLALASVPQQPWILVLSLSALFLGVLFYSYRPPYPWVWATLGLAILVGLGLWEPWLLLAIFFGFQPGLLVLVCVMLVLWIRQQCWQRQVILLPGFARVATGSVTQPRSAVSKQKRPSTVNALGSLPGQESEPSGPHEGGGRPST